LWIASGVSPPHDDCRPFTWQWYESAIGCCENDVYWWMYANVGSCRWISPWVKSRSTGIQVSARDFGFPASGPDPLDTGHGKLKNLASFASWRVCVDGFFAMTGLIQGEFCNDGLQ